VLVLIHKGSNEAEGPILGIGIQLYRLFVVIFRCSWIPCIELSPSVESKECVVWLVRQINWLLQMRLRLFEFFLLNQQHSEILSQ